jgi:two-component system, chemotaxis family, sensor kinase CheA
VEGNGAPVLIVHAQGKRTALRVDEVVGDLDLRIHPLPREIRDNDAYDGAATMPSGALVLAIRPAWLVNAHAGIELAAGGLRRALVVDDSLTARAVHRSMLEAGGFTVHAVADAKEALERLRRTRYDVVVCDVAMEPMSGLDFTSAVRSDSKRRSSPIVLVSAHDSPEDRALALAAGADGFLSKAECSRGHLLAEVGAAITRRREPPS